MSFEKYPKILYEKRRHKLPFWLVLTLFILGLFFVIVTLNIYTPSLVPGGLRLLSLNKKQNILLLGLDEVMVNGKDINPALLEWKGRSDTIIVLHCDPFKNALNILNIPRDTKIKFPGHGIEKMNYLNAIAGPVLTKKYIEKLVNVPIDHYVVVNLHGLSSIIDELGGVVVDVPQRMQYSDYAGMVTINLFPGRQLLNGKQIIDYARFRHDSLGDIGRIQRQQALMRQMFKKLLDPVSFTRLPVVISTFKKTILTDMKPYEVIRTANFVRNVPGTRQNILILPGGFGQSADSSYWLPDKKGIKELVSMFFYDVEKRQPFRKINPGEIKISILNASKKDINSGKKVKDLLTKHGYTVLPVIQYEEHVEVTKIYAQNGNQEIASQVKKKIGNFGELVVGNLGPPEAHVTILAGDDLANLKK